MGKIKIPTEVSCIKWTRMRRHPLSRLRRQHSTIRNGRSAALTSSLAALPCSLGLLRAASRTARALRAPPFLKGSLLDSGMPQGVALAKSLPLEPKGGGTAQP